MKKDMKKYENYIRDSLKVTSYYRMAYISFFNKKFSEALDCLRKVIEDYSQELRPDVYSFALILKIIIHFEMGNIRLMPYLIKTAQYHISKRNLMFKTEKVAIHYLKKLAKIKNLHNHKLIFTEFYDEIHSLSEESEYERRSLEIFDFLTWLKSYEMG